jgi:hypothetical protein
MMGMKTYLGILAPSFETGDEGTCWILSEDGKSGYDAEVNLDNGDHLKIFNSDGTVAFDGVIDQDHEAGWTEYPRNSGHGQPSALGIWILWTQKGWNPDDWAALFFNYDIKNQKRSEGYLRAELTKKREVVNWIVFSKQLKLANGINWYFDEKDVEHGLIDGQKRPNTIPSDIVAARLDKETIVLNRLVYLSFKGDIAILEYEESRPGVYQYEKITLFFDKNLINSAYRDEDTIYTK